jgi:arylformamidase
MTVLPRDISRTISPDSVVWAGSKPLGLTPICSIGPGSAFSVTKLDWTTHFLTHVDPPCHVIAGGVTLDQIPVSRFMGDALVVEARGDVVEPRDVPPFAPGMNVLFKTRNSDRSTLEPFDPDYVYIRAAAAEILAVGRANLVGIDYLSVDKFGDETYPSHYALLGNNVLILEGLDLSGVAPGRHHLIALPLRISAGDGSPVRAVLLPSAAH